MPYYLNYNPQSNFYFASENSDFKVNPYRSEGTYTKYSSLDDKLDNLHFYTWFIKTGRGRATEDAALEVRNGIITRSEAVALVKKYDGEFPKRYFKEILDYLDMNEAIARGRIIISQQGNRGMILMVLSFISIAINFA